MSKHKIKNIRVQEFKQYIVQKQFNGRYKPLLQFEFVASVRHRNTFLTAMGKNRDVMLVAYPEGKRVTVRIPMSECPIGILEKYEDRNVFKYVCAMNRRQELEVEISETD